MNFVRENYLFLIAAFATFVSLIWLAIAPDFEPVVTTLLGIVTCVGLRPKDWMLVQRRSLHELPDSYYKEAVEKRAGFFVENVYVEKTGYK